MITCVCFLSLALVRYSSDGKRLFFIRSTRFHDSRFLRLFRNYALLTGLPALAVITYVNVFIGEAELTEIAENYEPYNWEYYKHPITRWIVKYIVDPEEKHHEKALHLLSEEMDRMKFREQNLQVQTLMRTRGDGPWYSVSTADKSLVDTRPKATPDS
uniref:NADH dehydrogenase [ubiquinone] 1 beta subcomplex subunit 5, mitochondrial n=1 Tax=Eptatretus burgeri TaxID=7764 RepID=A0A8C4X0A0_EPTBU